MGNIIINAIPACNEAPASLELLKNDFLRFVELLTARTEKNATNYFLLINSQQRELIMGIQNHCHSVDFNLTVIPVSSESGFVYSNPEAALRTVNGESPLPKDINSDCEVYSVEEIISPESKTLYAFSSSRKPKRLYIPKRTTPAQILSEFGSDLSIKALFLGFPMGILLSPSELSVNLDLMTDYAYIFTEDDCILFQLMTIVESYMKECCGQCVFGYEGLYQIHTILTDISNKKGKASDLELIRELSDTMKTQCLCEIGKGAAGLVIDVMKSFETEISEHITKRNCKAAYCKKFMTYHILQDKCTGCMSCQDACDDDAIVGKKKFVHVIDQDECTQCGKCIDSCEYGAIVKAGAAKPKCPAKPVPCVNTLYRENGSI